MSRPSSARLLHAPPPADLGVLLGDFHALGLHDASDVDTTEVTAQICQTLRALSFAELKILEKVAQGMPADPAGPGPAFEDKYANPAVPAVPSR